MKVNTGDRCTVCDHPDVQLINDRMVTGSSIRKIAEEFSLGRESVRRHRHNHLPKELLKSKRMAEIVAADDLVTRIESLYEKAVEIIKVAQKDKKYAPAVSAIKEARSSLELLAKISGELRTGTTVNLTYSPQWIDLRSVLVNTLQEHPEVQAKVIKALERAETVEVINQ